MAEAATSAASNETHERLVYGATGGRKTVFSFVFLILLPFFVSLPAMIYNRLSAGLWFDSIGLAIMATGFTIVMFLVVIELMFSLFARVELGETSVKMTLPSGRGPTPMLRYRSHDIPYDQIQAVETRREIYGGSLVPVLLKGSRLVLKDGKTVPLGYVSEANVDPCFPYPEIAKKIADRARLPLIDRGNVWRSFRRKFFGIKTGRINVDTVDDAQIAELNRSHKNVVLGLVGALALLIVIGIVDDFAGGSPIGQTAAAFGTSPAKSPAKK